MSQAECKQTASLTPWMYYKARQASALGVLEWWFALAAWFDISCVSCKNFEQLLPKFHSRMRMFCVHLCLIWGHDCMIVRRGLNGLQLDLELALSVLPQSTSGQCRDISIHGIPLHRSCQSHMTQNGALMVLTQN